MMDLIIENEMPIVVQPTVVNTFGQTQAELLSRLKYWLNRATKFREGFLWVYKTVEQWAGELNKSVRTIKRAIKDLENKKVLISKEFESKEWYHGKSYRIDLDMMYGLLGIPNPYSLTKPQKKIENSRPVDNKGQDVQEDRQNVPIITPIPTSNNVCMGESKNGVREKEFWQEDDWPIVKTLGDSKIDPDSDAGITFAKIVKELKVNADQLRDALDILFNAKFYIRNPFGFIKKVLRDFISGDNAYFNYHYKKRKVT